MDAPSIAKPEAGNGSRPGLPMPLPTPEPLVIAPFRLDEPASVELDPVPGEGCEVWFQPWDPDPAAPELAPPSLDRD